MAQSKVAKNSITLREARKVLKVPNEDDYVVNYIRVGAPIGISWIRAIILETGIKHRTVKNKCDVFDDGVLFYCPRQNKLLVGYTSHVGFVAYSNQDIVELL